MNGLTKIDEGYGTAIDSTTIGLKRMQRTEADVKRCSVEKVFLEISQNSQENKVAVQALLKKRLWQSSFPVNFAKFLRTPPLQNTSGRLLPREPVKCEYKNRCIGNA